MLFKILIKIYPKDWFFRLFTIHKQENINEMFADYLEETAKLSINQYLTTEENDYLINKLDYKKFPSHHWDYLFDKIYRLNNQDYQFNIDQLLLIGKKIKQDPILKLIRQANYFNSTSYNFNLSDEQIIDLIKNSSQNKINLFFEYLIIKKYKKNNLIFSPVIIDYLFSDFDNIDIDNKTRLLKGYFYLYPKTLSDQQVEQVFSIVDILPPEINDEVVVSFLQSLSYFNSNHGKINILNIDDHLGWPTQARRQKLLEKCSFINIDSDNYLSIDENKLEDQLFKFYKIDQPFYASAPPVFFNSHKDYIFEQIEKMIEVINLNKTGMSPAFKKINKL